MGDSGGTTQPNDSLDSQTKIYQERGGRDVVSADYAG